MSSEINTVLILISLAYGFWALFMVFFSCEIGQRFTNAYDEVDDAINQLDWYLLPMKVQRVLPVIMMKSQKEWSIECFGSIACNRETFKKVCCIIEQIATIYISN